MPGPVLNTVGNKTKFLLLWSLHEGETETEKQKCDLKSGSETSKCGLQKRTRVQG